MRYPRDCPEDKKKLLKEEFKKRKDSPTYSRYLAVYLYFIGELKVEEIAELTCRSTRAVQKNASDFRKYGLSVFDQKPCGGRTHSYMTVDEEKKFMRSLEKKAMRGEITTALPVKIALEKKLGHKVSSHYAYDMMKRNNWSKVVPKSHHPKRSKAKIDSFKKKVCRACSKA